MRYLFFDIECCDGYHICEFGYVITDEKFNLIEKCDFVINPQKKFRLTNRKGIKDLELYYPEEEYKKSPLFPVYDDKIRELLEYKDQIVVGYSVGSDVKFLADVCKRYNLRYYNFDFFDMQKAYCIYANEKNPVALEKASEVLHLKKPGFLHKSDEDAMQTMEITKAVCESLETTLPEFRSICREACGRSDEGRFYYRQLPYSERLEMLGMSPDRFSKKQQRDCLDNFIKHVQPCGEIKQNRLTGKKLCFSGRFETENMQETYKLIQLLADCGCVYSKKVSDNEYYVVSDDELEDEGIKPRSRLNAAYGDHGEGRNVEIISFSEFYEILGTTKEELSKLPFPRLGKPEKKRTKKSFCGDYTGIQDGGATISEIVQANQR